MTSRHRRRASIDNGWRHANKARVSLETAQLILLAILFFAFFVGTVLGFGTTILTVTFSAQLLRLEEILPVIAPLNVALSLYLAIRHRQSIQWPLLVKRLLPAVGLGVPVGLLLFNLRDAQWLRLGFGVFVVAIASLQLFSPAAKSQRPMGKYSSLGMLGLGGVMHGLFNTGGPLIVYVLGRELDDKSEFRSTIAALFSVLTMVLIVDYVAVGLVTTSTAKLTGIAIVPVLGGLVLGEIAHRKLDAVMFKRAVWGLLFLGGLILTVRTALA